ncbi:MAG: thioredoxin-dependent thiol peroxidase [Alcanivoracaceae bacterium]|uniref:thioredoxin-dependent thiol peroxidase n=1 Tax=Alcanivorax sp. MD8A TaxID=1177157 RepID=UPI000C3B4962|nr:thioredoxin-dependent thiol peroxidase [Alcanivorax sp. MD8A]MAX55543.1 thioredoxin-dependent thiol peroxidase [Alcanivoracaceae bacterium]MCG8436827.1 thioredoxin-dependent thiol peroxidase [Pseudomonadales bacterium]MED5432967.1 thioredoxin-dependent thiol peroxidase [Pseudomonadota bacterium]MEE2870035.1 thioredoxin-dependent thiol peroxidase [Pseudomonadota bacterium]PNE03400.1 AhpC/TSA family protein [Alcanivorax sp. MD8A]|tara:strand:+ start:2661 stop:3137 length:477 start_codon:yes stop_codon:yes gene_type:complete
MAHPKIGNLAPNFKLPDQDDNLVELKSFKNEHPVVIFFYPKAMTPGCTTQACGIRDTRAELEKRGVKVFGISPDPVKRLPKFIEKHDLNFSLLSDEDHAVAEKYGCWGMKKFMGKEFMGLIRTTFIVGKDGKLLKVMDKFKTKSHHEDLLAELDELGI